MEKLEKKKKKIYQMFKNVFQHSYPTNMNWYSNQKLFKYHSKAFSSYIFQKK